MKVTGIIRVLFYLGMMLSMAATVFSQSAGLTGSESYHATTDKGSALGFEMFFYILDSSRQIYKADNLENLEITLENGQRYNIAPTQPTTPFYIVLVLDISGSMVGNANEIMKQAAIESLDSAPENALFSVVAFNSNVVVEQDFTSEKALVSSAINRLNAVSGSGTCLYDAMSVANNAISNVPPGRRAVIVFTDGVDEVQGGARCSSTPLENVISRASEVQVPFYTIGLLGRGEGGAQINEAELQRVSGQTGGISITGTLDDLTTLFTSIMEGLNSQWYFTLDMYPNEGTQTARITPYISGGQALQTMEVVFTSPRTFTPPVEFAFSVDSIRYDSTARQLQIVMSSSAAAEIGTVSVRFVNNQGLSDFETSVSDLAAPVVVDIAQLEAGMEYQVIVMPVSPSGANLLPEPVSQTVVVPASGPPVIPPQVTLMDIRTSDDGQALHAYLNIANGQQVRQLRYSIENADTNLSLNGAGGTSETIPEYLVIPLSSLEAGKNYRLVVDVMDASGTSLLTEVVTKEFADPRSPLELVLTVSDVKYDAESDTITLNLNSENTDNVEILSIWIVDAATDLRTGEPISVERTEGAIPISTENLERGKEYQVFVMPRDQGGNELLVEAAGMQFVYPLEKCSFVCKVTRFASHPIVLALLIVLLIGGVGYFAWNHTGKGAKAVETLAPINRDPTIVQSSPNVHSGSMLDTFGGTEVVKGGYYLTSVPSAGTAPGFPAASVNNRQQTEVINTFDARDTLHSIARAKLKVKSCITPKHTVVATNPSLRSRDGVEIPQILERFVIGRVNSDLNFPEDATVSRPHAVITFSDPHGQFKITNMSERNPLIVGGNNLRMGESLLLPHSQPVEIRLAQSVFLEFKSEPG